MDKINFAALKCIHPLQAQVIAFVSGSILNVSEKAEPHEFVSNSFSVGRNL